MASESGSRVLTAVSTRDVDADSVAAAEARVRREMERAYREQLSAADQELQLERELRMQAQSDYLQVPPCCLRSRLRRIV